MLKMLFERIHLQNNIFGYKLFVNEYAIYKVLRQLQFANAVLK